MHLIPCCFDADSMLLLVANLLVHFIGRMAISWMFLLARHCGYAIPLDLMSPASLQHLDKDMKARRLLIGLGISQVICS
jgi:hypothetical protein